MLKVDFQKDGVDYLIILKRCKFQYFGAVAVDSY